MPFRADPFHAEALMDGLPAGPGPGQAQDRILQSLHGLQQAMDIAGVGQGSVMTVRHDLRNAAAAGSNDRDFNRHGFNEDSPEGFRFGGGMNQDIQRGKGSHDVGLEGNELDAVSQVIGLHKLVQLGFVGGVFVEGTPNDNEAARVACCDPFPRGFEHDVLSLPRGKPPHDPEEWFGIGQSEFGAQRSGRMATIAIEGNPVVDGGGRGRGDSFMGEGVLAESGDRNEPGLKPAGARHEGASDRPSEEIWGKDVVHPPD